MKKIIINASMLVIVIANFYNKAYFESFNFKEFSLYFLSGALLVSLIYAIADYVKSIKKND